MRKRSKGYLTDQDLAPYRGDFEFGRQQVIQYATPRYNTFTTASTSANYIWQTDFDYLNKPVDVPKPRPSHPELDWLRAQVSEICALARG